MNKRLHWSLLMVFLLSPLFADNVVEEIVARVNNSIITNTELDKNKSQLKQEMEQQDPGNADKLYSEREKDLLRDMINQQLLLDRGKDLGITADTEVIKKLDEMRKQMNLDSMEALEKAAQSQGVSFEDFKQNMKNQIITQQVISKEIGSKMAISKEEVEKFYEEHKSDFEQPEQIRLSEILISTDPKTGSTEDAQKIVDSAEAKAKQLKDEIGKGASFEDVAKKSSEGPTATQGGDLGLFKRGTLAKELEDLTFAMKSGQVSDVIRTKQGWVLLKVTEHQVGGVPPLKDVEDK
ncbi:MAG: peptidylprolyl isomerase, partial [Acidobacteriales bacterium]|nr:peptidylprolyl isomerase [Terriglobales bacterium]